MQKLVLLFTMLISLIVVVPTNVMAFGSSTIICDNNSSDWIGFRKKSALFLNHVYEMRPKKNLWIELAEGDYCESMQTGSDSFSCSANINGTMVTTMVDFNKLIYIKIINENEPLTYNCIELE
jgi:hypothetical protein